MFKKLPLCSAVFLAACGGGSDDGGSGGGTPSTENLVDGSFQDARVAGVAYPNSMAGDAVGSYGRACFDEYNYFETADGRVQVYGSTAFSETDFKVVATMVSDRLDSALQQFGLTWDEYVAQRELLNMGALRGAVDHYQEYVNNPDYFGDPANFPAPERLSDADTAGSAVFEDPYAEDKTKWASWSGLSREEQIDFIRTNYLAWAYTPEHDTVAEKDLFLATDKVQVCLNDQMGGSQFGEGSQVGLQVPPNTSTYHSRVGEIFSHELVHHIQQNVANVGQNPYEIMPRWFTEGQAVYMSGQAIASVDHHYNFDPVLILGFYDEVDVLGDGGDPSTAYEHYGLAYKYLHESNGRDAIVQMMQDMKTNTDAPHVAMPANPEEWVEPPFPEYDEGMAFTRAFDGTIKNHTGASMTIEQYRTNYHDYMNAWQ